MVAGITVAALARSRHRGLGCRWPRARRLGCWWPRARGPGASARWPRAGARGPRASARRPRASARGLRASAGGLRARCLSGRRIGLRWLGRRWLGRRRLGRRRPSSRWRPSRRRPCRDKNCTTVGWYAESVSARWGQSGPSESTDSLMVALVGKTAFARNWLSSAVWEDTESTPTRVRDGTTGSSTDTFVVTFVGVAANATRCCLGSRNRESEYQKHGQGEKGWWTHDDFLTVLQVESQALVRLRSLVETDLILLSYALYTPFKHWWMLKTIPNGNNCQVLPSTIQTLGLLLSGTPATIASHCMPPMHDAYCYKSSSG